MIFDSEWLIEHLAGAPDPDTLAESLTDCGCLVEVREPGDGAEKWDVEVTTNRPDAMNHRGLAREAALATGATLLPLEIEFEESDEDAAELAAVEIADDAACSRYVARVIRGVTVGESPEWMRRRLLNCGIRPINVVVDVTNYVLLELGQPLHAFDLERVRGRKIVVRSAIDGEKLTTLDGEERELDPSMLMIADGEGIMALAGIMGGGDSEIHENTTDVLLESAHFDALSVRRTARRLGMHTEASHRFERGTDPEMAAVACDRAAALIAELAGGRVCRGRIDVYPRPFEAPQMELSIAELSAFAGLEIPAERVVEIFRGLEFTPEISGDVIRVTVPPWRVDIERVPDLYEEVIRHVGYDAIPSELPVLATTPGRRSSNWELIDRARDAAVSTGLVEVMTWSFIDPETDELIATQPLCPGPSLPLDNPLAQTQAVMRRSLLPGLLAAANANFNQGQRTLALFEQGRVFSRADERPQEWERIGVLLADEVVGREERFVRLKGIVDDLIRRIGLPGVFWKRGGSPWLDPDAGALILTADGTMIGFAGILSSELAARWDLRHEVAVAELDLEKATEPPLSKFRSLHRHPPVVVDVTVEHPVDFSYAELIAAAGDLASDWVEDVSLVVRYRDEKALAGAVRTTLRLVYRHADRSLTQDEVNEAHERLRRGLVEKLGVALA
jgi:phenylalanyl-tRNA synthetase beta chain